MFGNRPLRRASSIVGLPGRFFEKRFPAFPSKTALVRGVIENAPFFGWGVSF